MIVANHALLWIGGIVLPYAGITPPDAKHALVVRGYGKFDTVANNLQSLVLLFVRLCFGWELFVSGRGHLNNVDAMIKNFTDWGVPFPHINVYISAYTEMIGGLFILFGLLSRLVSVPLTFNFIVAYLTASRKTITHLLFGPGRLDAVDDFTGDAAFFFLVAALITLAFGPGKVSLDFVLSRTVFKRTRIHPAPEPSAKTS
jgi:putative oxidoreductase